MARRRPWEVEDELWELIERLPKVERRFRYPGRKRLDDRKALCRRRKQIDESVWCARDATRAVWTGGTARSWQHAAGPT